MTIEECRILTVLMPADLVLLLRRRWLVDHMGKEHLDRLAAQQIGGPFADPGLGDHAAQGVVGKMRIIYADHRVLRIGQTDAGPLIELHTFRQLLKA